MIGKAPHCLLFFFTLVGYTQNHSVSGSVMDENNKPVAFSNVVIYTETSDFVKGTTTNDLGGFKLEGLKSGVYVLKITYLGFEGYSRTLDLDKPINLGAIVLKEKNETLDGVTVVAKRPTVKRLVDRTVFNVENSTLSNTNVLDVLKHTPGVIVADNKITVKNAIPTVYINDKKVQLSSNEIQQLLEGTTASNLKSVEVITSPPAKYEAEGGAVLNIVTSKNIIAGYNGSVFGNFKQGYKYPKQAIGTSHFFKAKRINAYLNYSISPRKDYRHNDEFVSFKDGTNQTSSIWETDFKRTRESSNHSISTNIDYDFNNNNSLGFSSNILFAPRDRTKNAVNSLTEVFDANQELDSLFNTINKAVYETVNKAFTLSYSHGFKAEGEKFSANIHHTNYEYSSFQDVVTGYFLPNANIPFRDNRFQTFASQSIQLYTGQIDYELPLKKEAFLESGLKVSKINSKSILNQFIFNDGEKVEDVEESDVFLYDEVNYALYSSFSKDWDNWSLKSGLRVEYTDIEGESLLANSANANNYIKVFPSFHLLNRLDENNELYFNYNRRIYRPRYSELNPFKYYLSDNVFAVGNPKLKPQIDDIYILGYTMNKNYTFELYYRYENNPTLQLVQQDNDINIVKYINTNIDRNISYGLDFMTYTRVVPRWNLYVLSSLFYYEGKFYTAETNNSILTNDKWAVYAQINNYFTFLKDKSLTIDVAYVYISPIVDGPSVYSTRHGLDIDLRKTLWGNRASISVGVTDVFNTQNFTETNRYANQDMRLKSRLENRLFTFGFNYKFGNFRLNPNKKDLEIEERDRLEQNESYQ